MRRGVCLLIGVAALVSPPSALATNSIAVGDVAGVVSTNHSISFDLNGKVNKKGRFVLREVSGFSVSVPFNCFDATGNLLSSSIRSDLPFGLMNAGRIGKQGNFHVAHSEGDTSVAVSGTLRKGKTFSGLAGATQGPTNGAHCSTGTFTNPAISWRATVVRPVCTGTTATDSVGVRRCVPPRH